MRKIMSLLAVVFLATFFAPSLAEANCAYPNPCYVGNSRSTGYGTKATISTPPSAPNLVAGVVLSWVSTPITAGYWVQAGWYCDKAASVATRYYEYGIGGVGYPTDYGTQPWGSTNTYEVRTARNGSLWSTYVNGAYTGSFTVSSGMVPSQAYTEIQQSSLYPINTHFTSVSYMASNYSYYSFDQWNFVTAYTYRNIVHGNQDYETVGP